MIDSMVEQGHIRQILPGEKVSKFLSKGLLVKKPHNPSEPRFVIDYSGLKDLFVVKITGGPSDPDPPPPSTQPPPPRDGKGGSFDNHPRYPVTHETLYGLINFFQNRQEGDKDSVNTGHHQFFSLMVVIFLISLLIGLLILTVCCLRGKCSKILTLAPMRPSSSGVPPSSHLPLAVLPPVISAPHHLTPQESHLGQAQLQRPCSNPAFPQDNWRPRFENGGGEAGRQHLSLVDERLLRAPDTQGSSGLETQPGVLAPNSWYAPRAPALELDVDYQQPAFSPPTTYPHPPGCLPEKFYSPLCEYHLFSYYLVLHQKDAFYLIGSA